MGRKVGCAYLSAERAQDMHGLMVQWAESRMDFRPSLPYLVTLHATQAARSPAEALSRHMGPLSCHLLHS